jgi:hypothetical protein
MMLLFLAELFLTHKIQRKSDLVQFNNELTKCCKINLGEKTRIKVLFIYIYTHI